MEIRSSSAEELRALASTVLSTLSVRPNEAVVVTLSGELGAGKTTFVQGAAKMFGVEGVVTSPTFVIEKIYRLTSQKWQRLIHIDAYRLKSSQELEVLGWKELIADAGNFIILEWPERVSDLIPKDAVKVRFDIDAEKRIITVDGGEKSKSKK